MRHTQLQYTHSSLTQVPLPPKIPTLHRTEPCTSRTATSTSLPTQHRKQAPKRGASESNLNPWRVAPKNQKPTAPFMPAWAHRLPTFSFAIPATIFPSSSHTNHPRSFINLRPVPLFPETQNHTSKLFSNLPFNLIASRKTKTNAFPTMVRPIPPPSSQ
ncbi:hypothetical protein GGI42DRAFT_202730 [Trichoderma sp. SZMC 28013]